MRHGVHDRQRAVSPLVESRHCNAARVPRSEFCEEHLPQSSSIQWLLTVGSVGKNDQKCSYHLFARIQLQEAALAGCEKEVGSC